MAFPKQTVITNTPTAITDLRVILHSPDPRGEVQPNAAFRVGILYSTGEIRELEGDLVPHLTQSEINQLLSFLSTLRTRAVAQLLP